MELPDDILNIIKEYSQPMTRPDWRKGCYYNRRLYGVYGLKYKFKFIVNLLHRVLLTPFYCIYDRDLYSELLYLRSPY
jgi:hypothetical protein